MVAIDATLGYAASVTPLSVPSLLLQSELRRLSSVEQDRFHDLKQRSTPAPFEVVYRRTSSLVRCDL